jgi:hypothetical protein
MFGWTDDYRRYCGLDRATARVRTPARGEHVLVGNAQTRWLYALNRCGCRYRLFICKQVWTYVRFILLNVVDMADTFAGTTNTL